MGSSLLYAPTQALQKPLNVFLTYFHCTNHQGKGGPVFLTYFHCTNHLTAPLILNCVAHCHRRLHFFLDICAKIGCPMVSQVQMLINPLDRNFWIPSSLKKINNAVWKTKFTWISVYNCCKRLKRIRKYAYMGFKEPQKNVLDCQTPLAALELKTRAHKRQAAYSALLTEDPGNIRAVSPWTLGEEHSVKIVFTR